MVTYINHGTRADRYRYVMMNYKCRSEAQKDEGIGGSELEPMGLETSMPNLALARDITRAISGSALNALICGSLVVCYRKNISS